MTGAQPSRLLARLRMDASEDAGAPVDLVLHTALLVISSFVIVAPVNVSLVFIRRAPTLFRKAFVESFI
jgi:hypothetical protein